jgi:hypothetical protein
MKWSLRPIRFGYGVEVNWCSSSTALHSCCYAGRTEERGAVRDAVPGYIPCEVLETYPGFPEFGAALGDNQAGFDRLPQAHFVCEDAPAFAETSQRKDYRVDLVRIRIDARLPLRRRISLRVVWSADEHEILCKNALIECVDCCHRRSYQPTQCVGHTPASVSSSETFLGKTTRLY